VESEESGQTLAEVSDHAKTLAHNYFSLINSEKDFHMPPLPDPVNPGASKTNLEWRMRVAGLDGKGWSRMVGVTRSRRVQTWVDLSGKDRDRREAKRSGRVLKRGLRIIVSFLVAN
jgi:hypothetical protein